VLGAFRDPYAGTPLVLASLPLKAVEATEFQRDLSRTHAQRLATAIGSAGVFLDPIVAVWTKDGFRSPNGRHRLAAAKQLGQRAVTALLVADEAIVYRILPLNTEKAHNLRDRSLEVIRMARAIAKERPRTKENEELVAFEAPFLLTLGACYEQRTRFSGSAYQPMLRRVEQFLDATVPKALQQRQQWANRILKIDDLVAKHVKALQERGMTSPYLKTLVVARCNPVRWIPQKRGAPPPMTTAEAIARMDAAAKKFDPAKVKMGDLALVAAVAPEEE
jgi:ParB family chromosome partitioning protein